MSTTFLFLGSAVQWPSCACISLVQSYNHITFNRQLWFAWVAYNQQYSALFHREDWDAMGMRQTRRNLVKQ